MLESSQFIPDHFPLASILFNHIGNLACLEMKVALNHNFSALFTHHLPLATDKAVLVVAAGTVAVVAAMVSVPVALSLIRPLCEPWRKIQLHG